MRTRTKAESATYKARIVELVSQQPMTSTEISEAIGVNGCSLGNYFTMLLREGLISRHQYKKGLYRYYPGQTAPDVPYRVAPQPKPEKPKTNYRVPVKHINVAREYFGEPRPVRITLPAGPWEISA